MNSSSMTEDLSSFVSGLSPDDVPTEQFKFAKWSLLDWIGCCLAGGQETATRSLLKAADTLGGAGTATVLVDGSTRTMLDAVLINGAAGNLLDMDDVHPGLIGHTSSVLSPTVLSLTEHLVADGMDLLTAYVAGYEVMVRLGYGLEPGLYERGWHATGVLGVFGAAAAAGHLLRLNPHENAQAFAIAATQAAGLRGLFGTPSKFVHHGKAAAAGILSALLVQSGVTSTPDIFGHRHGLRVLAEDCDVGAVLEELGTRFHLDETCYKRHAACGAVHAAIDACIELRDSNELQPSQIDRVSVRTHKLSYDLTIDNVAPETPFEAKYSMHYSLAIALAYGRSDHDLYNDQVLTEPQVRGLASKVQMSVDPEMEYVEAMPADVEIRTVDGERFTKRVDAPKGRPSNPFEWDDVVAKFRKLSDPVMSADSQNHVIGEVEQLENVASVGDLLKVFHV